MTELRLRRAPSRGRATPGRATAALLLFAAGAAVVTTSGWPVSADGCTERLAPAVDTPAVAAAAGSSAAVCELLLIELEELVLLLRAFALSSGAVDVMATTGAFADASDSATGGLVAMKSNAEGLETGRLGVVSDMKLKELKSSLLCSLLVAAEPPVLAAAGFTSRSPKSELPAVQSNFFGQLMIFGIDLVEAANALTRGH